MNNKFDSEPSFAIIIAYVYVGFILALAIMGLPFIFV